MASQAELIAKAEEAQAETRTLLDGLAERGLATDAVEQVLAQLDEIVSAFESGAAPGDVLATARAALKTGLEIEDEVLAGESLRRDDYRN
jgi:hypothetical protein